MILLARPRTTDGSLGFVFPYLIDRMIVRWNGADEMFKEAVPILGVSSSVAAEEFYCGKLGFGRVYAWRPHPTKQDPCYMGVVRDSAHIVVSSFPGDGPPGTRTVQIYVEDAAAVYEEYRQVGIAVGKLWDQSWGNIEFSFEDPDGNSLCIAQDKNG